MPAKARKGAGQAGTPRAAAAESARAPDAIARVGRPAPDFEAPAFANGKFKNIRLSDYRGKWVALIFYPGDFTFVCPTELAAVAVRHGELKAMGVHVLAISTDSQFTHKVWQEEELSKMVPGGVPFPLLSDAGGHVGKMYGVFDEETGTDVRGRFLIDPEGVVQSVEILAGPVGRNVTELIRQARAFQHVRETQEVTPSGWQPGRRGLKAAPDLAGKVWKAWKPEDALHPPRASKARKARAKK